jgi:serine/threonine-protein kinase
MATCPTCRAQYPNDAAACPKDGARLLPDEAFSGVEPDLAEGHAVGEYRIERKLGEGGFGSVYRATHPLIGKTAAIKVLHRQYSSNPQMVSRFIAEARAVNQIRHKNIIDIFSFGSLEDGRQYYVMELLEGATCEAYIAQKGRLSPEEAIPILRGVARALDAAHAAGIAHRDLKPENVFLVFDEDHGVFPKLLDFGIAKLLGDSGAASHKTRTGTPMGTPSYMSPEQCRGKSIDHRTDIYSFGILAYVMLTGRVPFEGEDVMDILVKQVNERPRPLSEVRPDLPAALDGPVLKMLEKDPANRPTSLTACVDALAQAARDAGFAVQVPSGRPSGPDGKRSDGPTPVVKVRSSDDALADAKTMVQDAGPAGSPRPTGGEKTVLAAEAPSAAASPRRAVLVAALGALALAAAAAIAFMATTGEPAASPAGGAEAAAANGAASPAKPEATATAATAAMGAMGAMGATAPSGSAEVVPVAPLPGTADAPAEVELTIEGAPAGADVSSGGKKLGTAPGPIKVKRGDASVTLTVSKPGYKSKDVPVVPTANQIIPAALAKVPAAPPPAGPGKRPSSDLPGFDETR